MKKILKIRFVKFERAIATQVLEQEGFFKATEHIGGSTAHSFYKERIYLYSPKEYPFEEYKYRVDVIGFDNNAERDEYLEKVVRWISAEQFATGRKLKIGEACLFSDDGKDWHSGEYAGKCARQLGKLRFLALDGDVSLTRWKYVKPLYGALKVDGDVYTWEMEVAE